MSNNKYCIALVVCALGAACASLVQAGGAATIEPVKDFRDLLSIAHKLDSAEMVLGERDEAREQKRRELLYSFAREAKGSMCRTYYDQIMAVSQDYKIKAYQYLEDQLKKKNNQKSSWFSFFARSNPLKPVLAVASVDPMLTAMANAYEEQMNKDALTHSDIDCDVERYQMKNLDSILLVLALEVKYLLTEDSQVINRAIYERLRQDQFVVANNFYDMTNINDKQEKLLLQYYSDHVDPQLVKLGQAVDHYYQPGEYVIARLMSACQTISRYESDWKALESTAADTCGHVNPLHADQLVANQFNIAKYEDTLEFCRSFLDAL